jgi:hypothetical protein
MWFQLHHGAVVLQGMGHAPGPLPSAGIRLHTGQRDASEIGAASRSSTHFRRSCARQITQTASGGHSGTDA